MNAQERVTATDPGVDPEEILSSRQYADMKGVTVHAVYAERHRGRGPEYHRIGDPLTGRVFYTRRAIEEHLRQQWQRKPARSPREEAEGSPELLERRAQLAARAYRTLAPHWARRRGANSPD